MRVFGTDTSAGIYLASGPSTFMGFSPTSSKE